MEHVSFCPYRLNINYNWSSIQQTEHTAPVFFNGELRDVNVVEVCKEVEESGKQVETPGVKIQSKLRRVILTGIRQRRSESRNR
jgi:hypothetical protein